MRVAGAVSALGFGREILHLHRHECGGLNRLGGGGAVWADGGVHREWDREWSGGVGGVVGGAAVAVRALAKIGRVKIGFGGVWGIFEHDEIITPISSLHECTGIFWTYAFAGD